MTKRILLADDYAPVRRAICELLASHGYAFCEQAVDGIDAVEKAERLTPDLVILDINMPKLNGIVAASAIRSRLPDTPIILLTLHEPDVALVAGAGINGVVSKNDLVARLPEMVRKLVGEN